MRKKYIDPKEASVAATFFQPSYQRLRQWHGGRAINLLCFVEQTNDNVRQLLKNIGATPSPAFRARCFSEIWEVPDDAVLADFFQGEVAKMDQQIAEGIGCVEGKYSAACGTLQWGDIKQGSQRRHFESHLLQESTRGNRRAR